ncbi:Rhodanese-like domain-containing protein, partial [Cynara cardunculus var. scolymus]
MASAFLSRTFFANRVVSSFALNQKPQKLASLLFKKPLHLWASSSRMAYMSTSSIRSDMASTAVGSTATFLTQSMSTTEPVVSVDWLHANLREPDIKVAHIPGALFFDVDGISDRTTNLPHMLPSDEAFAAAVSALGIENKDGVVVYDDGGLPRWRASGFDVESSASSDAILKASAASEAIEKVYHGQAVGPVTFLTKYQPHLVWTLEQ